jgi:hypothetical protein
MKKLFFLFFLVLGFGCDKEETTVSEGPAPIASFEITNQDPKVGEEVVFVNTSQNANTYEWDFGDNNTATDENPGHVYDQPGTYTVRLFVKNFRNQRDSTSRVVGVKIPVNIFPGVGAWELTLGQFWGPVKNMSTLDLTEYGPVFIPPNTWLHPVEDEERGIFMFFLGSGGQKTDVDPLVLIELKQPFLGQTEEGIQIGSSLNAMKTAYGEEYDYSETSHSYRYEDLGISFYFDDSEMAIEEIGLFPL